MHPVDTVATGRNAATSCSLQPRDEPAPPSGLVAREGVCLPLDTRPGEGV